jgi:hypothetical protein
VGVDGARFFVADVVDGVSVRVVKDRGAMDAMASVAGGWPKSQEKSGTEKTCPWKRVRQTLLASASTRNALPSDKRDPALPDLMQWESRLIAR